MPSANILLLVEFVTRNSFWANICETKLLCHQVILTDSDRFVSHLGDCL